MGDVRTLRLKQSPNARRARNGIEILVEAIPPNANNFGLVMSQNHFSQIDAAGPQTADSAVARA